MMKYVFTPFVAIVLLFTLVGCSSTKLTVESVPKEQAEIAPKPIAFDTFWDAMQSVNIDYLSNHQDNADYKMFGEAFSLVLAGNLDAAENKLQTLYRSTNDALVRQHSKKILASLLFSQSKWNELLTMPSEPSDQGLASDNHLAKAFSTLPKEEYVFPGQSQGVSMGLTSTGSPIVEVEVNGRKQKFWLDTGAGLTVIASDIAEECDIKSLGGESIEVGTATTKKITGYPASVKELNIGGVIIRNHPALILNKADLEFKLLGFIKLLKIDGIIGWNAIRNVALQLDYKNNIATVKQPANADNTNRNLFWLGYPIVRLRSQDGVALNFGLDTGAKTSSIRPVIFTKIASDNVTSTTKTIGGAGGMEKTETKVLPNLSLVLNGLSLHFEKISTSPSDPAAFVKLDGILGNDIIKNRVLFIDYRNGIINLSLPEQGK